MKVNGQLYARGAKLTSYFHAMQRLRMREAIPPLPDTLSKNVAQLSTETILPLLLFGSMKIYES
jgi:hypothetical protein